MRVWRLRPSGEFERVRQSGRSHPHRLLVVIVQPRSDAPDAPPRVAVVAGRKLGNAVIRNRARRRLREAVRQIYAHLSPGIDLIVMARAPLLQSDLADIVAALSSTLQRAQVWRAGG